MCAYVHTQVWGVLWDEKLTMFKKETDIHLKEMKDVLFKSK